MVLRIYWILDGDERGSCYFFVIILNVNLGSVIDTSRTFQCWSRYSIRYDEYKVIYSRTDGDSIHSIRTTLSAEYHKSKSVHQIASLLFAIWFPFDKRELLGWMVGLGGYSNDEYKVIYSRTDGDSIRSLSICYFF